MTDEKACYNCGNKNCNVYYSTVKKDYKRHFETYEYKDFDCVNHNKWEELKMEEIHTDNTKTLQNALDRIEELEAQIEKMKCCENCAHDTDEDNVIVQTDHCTNCFELCNWQLRRQINDR